MNTSLTESPVCEGKMVEALEAAGVRLITKRVALLPDGDEDIEVSIPVAYRRLLIYQAVRQNATEA
jgi:hypothetical protein